MLGYTIIKDLKLTQISYSALSKDSTALQDFVRKTLAAVELWADFPTHLRPRI